MIDVDEFRTSQVNLHGLTGIDRIATFYHDETNNVRSLHVGQSGLNVAALKVFVLGGVVHEGPARDLNIDSLRRSLHIQRSANEIKLEHVAKGDIFKVLSSRRMTIFLDWIDTNGLLLHYYQLDPFYWSVIDIVDSIVPFLRDRRLMSYLPLLKADLTVVMRADLVGTLDLMRRHAYPDVPPENQDMFLTELIAMLDSSAELLDGPNLRVLRSVLTAGKSLDGLAFVQGGDANRLIDNFGMFYASRIALFSNSGHVLDMEETIRRRFQEVPLHSAGELVSNYRFADSKSEPGIQLAGVVAGLLGKLHTYLVDTPVEQVTRERALLTGTALENVGRLSAMLSCSHDVRQAHLHHVASIHDLNKLETFLRFRGGDASGVD